MSLDFLLLFDQAKSKKKKRSKPERSEGLRQKK